MKQRVITAICLVLAVLPPLLIGGWAFEVLAWAFIIVATNEILNLVATNWPKQIRYSTILINLLAVLALHFNEKLLIALIACLIIYYFALVVWCDKIKVNEVAVCFIIASIILLTVLSFEMMYAINRNLVWFILFATFVTDTFALFGGMAFGKHKLNERISPKKTIEGSVVGWLVGTTVCFVYGLFFIKEISLPTLIILSSTITIISQLGDLAFSAIKREFEIKDFGKIFPGHGGVLDRIDSLVFSCLWLYILLTVL